ncbi:MAG: ribonuclease HI family protein [Candidatus Gottesmanbacteria bacterium]
MKNIIVFTDGGARGNPGPAAVGVIIKSQTDKEEIIASFGKRIGKTTNNVAEYSAVIEALVWIKQNSSIIQMPDCLITFFLDSKLVVNQLNGYFKINDSHLRDLLVRIRQLETEIGKNIFYNFIPREQNQLADRLVNKALDAKI